MEQNGTLSGTIEFCIYVEEQGISRIEEKKFAPYTCENNFIKSFRFLSVSHFFKGNMGNVGNILDISTFQTIASFFQLGQHGQHIKNVPQLLPLLPFPFSLGQHTQNLYL